MSFQIYILNIYQTQQCKIEQNNFFSNSTIFLKRSQFGLKWASFLIF